MTANRKMTDAEYDIFIAEVSAKIRHPSWCLAHGTRDTDSVIATDVAGEWLVFHSRDIAGVDPDVDQVGVFISQADVYGPGLTFLGREPAEVRLCEYDPESLTAEQAKSLDHARFVAATLIEYDQSVGGHLPRPTAVVRHRTWHDVAMMA